MAKKSEKGGMVKEAILDLENELKSLSKKKATLKRELEGIDMSVVNARQTEQKLQGRISQLIKKEAELKERKGGLESKEDALADKLSKIKKIKSDLSQI